MKPQFIRYLSDFQKLASELAAANEPAVLKTLGKKQAALSPTAEKIQQLEELEKTIAENKKLADSNEHDLAELAEDELKELATKFEQLEKKIEEELLPKNPHDDKDVILEIRAGAGGDEASLFAAELFRMYMRYAESRGFRNALVSSSRNEVGGFKEVIFEVSAATSTDHNGPYAFLKFESGVHRVQRVPKTEKSGRIHTSTVTVAVLPVIPEAEFKIAPADLKIETSTSRGAGGQSVNTTYSAIKITHLPTGITASSQDERSQIQNRAKALEVLTARVFAFEEEKKQRELTTKRKSQIGSGDRSEKIRTYNFPQDRVTDHRINQSFKQIAEILDGKLDEINAALQEANRKLLQDNADLSLENA